MTSLQSCFFAHLSLGFFIIVCLSLLCVYVAVFVTNVPSFADPQLGFETRGTVLAKRAITWGNIHEQLKLSGILVEYPDVEELPVTPKIKKRKKKGKKRKQKPKVSSTKLDLSHKRDSMNNGFFCTNPTDEYAHLIIKSKSDNDLLSIEGIRDMCDLQNQLVESKNYADICETIENENCCPIWSLPNVIAAMNRVHNCSMLTDLLITDSILKIKNCYDILYNSSDIQISPECKNYHNLFNVVYNYLIISDIEEIIETVLFLPASLSIATIPYYEELVEEKKLSYGNIETVALNFGIKQMLFDQFLIKDLNLIIFGIILISILIWIDSKSIIFTTLVILIVILSVIFAYVFYMTVLDLKFFPFMNILAVIVSIGIGVDDAFVYHQIWLVYKNTMSDESTIRILLQTSKHSFLLMLSTTITTAVAFFTLYFNEITSIKCFSIFAGIVVIFNFILVIAMLPLVLRVIEKFNCFQCVKRVRFSNHVFVSSYFNKTVAYWNFIIFVILSILSLCIVFIYPRLELANTFDIQLFESDNLFEKYDSVYSDKLRFHQNQYDYYKMPLIFVWGIIAEDQGDYLNPARTGELSFDSKFNISTKESQQWLYDFCEDLKSQSFFEEVAIGAQLKNCLLVTFRNWMENRKCIEPITQENNSPCCENKEFPYEPEVFQLCLKFMINDLRNTPAKFFEPNSIAGLKFFRENLTLNSIIIEYNSDLKFSFSYQEIDTFYKTVEYWFQGKLINAPDSLKNGWFYSDFQFYDLQHVLINSTFLSIIISMSVTFLLLLLLTSDLIVSICAILSITFSIFFTIAVLIIYGWKLSIFEAISISTAIGLSTDFSLHYSFHFCYFIRMFRRKDLALVNTLHHIRRPTIMSALTTASIGIFMIPSSILIYKQIGVFLILVMFSSWIFATYFFLSLLIIFYPEKTEDPSVPNTIEVSTLII